MDIEQKTLASVAGIIESKEDEVERVEALRDFMRPLKQNNEEQFKSLQLFINHQVIVQESFIKPFYYPGLGILGLLILFSPFLLGLYLIITPSVHMPWLTNYSVHPPLLGLLFISIFGCIESWIRLKARAELYKLAIVKMVMNCVELGNDPVEVVRFKDILSKKDQPWFKRF